MRSFRRPTSRCTISGIPARRSTFSARAASGCCRCTPTCICWRRPTITYTVRWPSRRRAASSRACCSRSPPRRRHVRGPRLAVCAVGARRLVHLKPYAHLPRDGATTRESLAACYSNETFPGPRRGACAAPPPAGGVGAAGGARRAGRQLERGGAARVYRGGFRAPECRRRAADCRADRGGAVARGRLHRRRPPLPGLLLRRRRRRRRAPPRRSPPRGAGAAAHRVRRAAARRAADVLALRERRYRRCGERDVRLRRRAARPRARGARLVVRRRDEWAGPTKARLHCDGARLVDRHVLPPQRRRQERECGVVAARLLEELRGHGDGARRVRRRLQVRITHVGHAPDASRLAGRRLEAAHRPLAEADGGGYGGGVPVRHPADAAQREPSAAATTKLAAPSGFRMYNPSLRRAAAQRSTANDGIGTSARHVRRDGVEAGALGVRGAGGASDARVASQET